MYVQSQCRYEPGRRDLHECRYNQNEGYVVFSAMGSFFIPMAVMVYVYVRISCVVASRHDHMTEIEVHKVNEANIIVNYTRFSNAGGCLCNERRLCVKTNTHNNQCACALYFVNTQKQNRHFDVEVEPDLEQEPSSEQESHLSPYRKRGTASASAQSTPLNSLSTNTTTILVDHHQTHRDKIQHRNGQYELVNTSRQPSLKRHTNHLTTTTSTSCGGGVHAKSAVVHKSQSWHKSTQNCSTKPSSGHSMVTAAAIASTSAASPYEQKQIRAHHKSLSNRISSLKRENKTTQTLSIVVGGFIVCWLPFFVYYLITPFLPHESVSGNITNGLTWLGWFNSAMNPFIYAFYSVDFRAAFWRLTFRRFFKNSVKAPYTSNAMSIRR